MLHIPAVKLRVELSLLRQTYRGVYLTLQVLLDPTLPLSTQKLAISTPFTAPRVGGIDCEPLYPFNPLSPEMLPPVRLCKYATPVKAKTSAPLPLPHTTCAALTWRGLGE